MIRCSHCGAKSQSTIRPCDYCGTVPEVPSAELDLEAEARLDGLDPYELDRMMKEGPDPNAPRPSNRGAWLPLFMTIGMGALFFQVHSEGNLPEPPVGYFLIACFVGVPFMIFLRTQRRGRVRARSPIEEHKAVVMAVGKEDVDATDTRRAHRTTIVLKIKRGAWRRVRASEHLADQLRRGDSGVAFLRANTLLDFKRVS